MRGGYIYLPISTFNNFKHVVGNHVDIKMVDIRYVQKYSMYPGPGVPSPTAAGGRADQHGCTIAIARLLQWSGWIFLFCLTYDNSDLRTVAPGAGRWRCGGEQS